MCPASVLFSCGHQFGMSALHRRNLIIQLDAKIDTGSCHCFNAIQQPAFHRVVLVLADVGYVVLENALPAP